MNFYETGQEVCNNVWRTTLRETYAAVPHPNTFTDREGPRVRPDPEAQFGPANRQNISAHISSFFPSHEEEIMAAYLRGPAVASGTQPPVFLAWQPLPGFEHSRLWTEGWYWSIGECLPQTAAATSC